MKIHKIKYLLLILAVTVLISGCGITQITDKNKSSASINPDAIGTNPDLFDTWSPLSFERGQTLSYNFEINTGKYTVNGNFILSVSGLFKSKPNFSWQFTIGHETNSGSFRGSSADFVAKLKEFCSENTVEAMIFEALFTTYEGTEMFNNLVASKTDLEIGMTWTTSYQGQSYEHKLESIDTYGAIDGFSVVSSVNGIPSQVICISPFIPLPSMVMFLMESDSGEASHIVCELSGAVLPD